MTATSSVSTPSTIPVMAPGERLLSSGGVGTAPMYRMAVFETPLQLSAEESQNAASGIQSECLQYDSVRESIAHLAN